MNGALVNFIKNHRKYNLLRKEYQNCTSTESELLALKKEFEDQNPNIYVKVFRRNENFNDKTACAHGTNGWAIFLACALAVGYIIPGNAIKLTGIFANGGENRGKDRRNCNAVSAISLTDQDCEFGTTMNNHAKRGLSRTGFCYQKFQDKLTKKYKKRGGFSDEEITSIFNSDLETAYHKLSYMPITVIGDGIGYISESCVPYGSAGMERDEVLYERVNVRAIIVNPEDKDFIQNLIRSIDHNLAQSIAFITSKEIENFQQSRKKEFTHNKNESKHVNSFITDFFNHFNGNLPFRLFVNSQQSICYKRFLYAERTFIDLENGKVKLRVKPKTEIKYHLTAVRYHIESAINDSEEIKFWTEKFFKVAEKLVKIEHTYLIHLEDLIRSELLYAKKLYTEASDEYRKILQDFEKCMQSNKDKHELNHTVHSVKKIFEHIKGLMSSKNFQGAVDEAAFEKVFNDIVPDISKLFKQSEGQTDLFSCSVPDVQSEGQADLFSYTVPEIQSEGQTNPIYNNNFPGKNFQIQKSHDKNDVIDLIVGLVIGAAVCITIGYFSGVETLSKFIGLAILGGAVGYILADVVINKCYNNGIDIQQTIS